MLKYAAQRVVMMIGIMFGVLVVTFLLSRVLPSSPVEIMLGHRPTPEQVEIAKRDLGLDRPVHEQFLSYLGDIVQGDFGVSLRTGQPVLDDLFLRMTATFELTTLAVILVIAAGVPLGVMSAVKRNSMADQATRTLSMAGVALPAFLLGMLLQMLFYGGFDQLVAFAGADRQRDPA